MTRSRIRHFAVGVVGLPPDLRLRAFQQLGDQHGRDIASAVASRVLDIVARHERGDALHASERRAIMRMKNRERMMREAKAKGMEKPTSDQMIQAAITKVLEEKRAKERRTA